MTATSSAIASPASATRRHPVLRSTLVVGVAAAAIVTVAAAGLHAAGVSFAVDGETIPLAGFAQMTFLGAVIGGLVLAGLNRWSNGPARRFYEVTAVLTVLSCVPSVALPQGIATQVALVALHLVAAAIIVPVLARHAHR
jgi:hypothetical protein